MWLVLSDDGDMEAHWAVAGLRCRGLDPLFLLTAESLRRATRWEHRVSERGQTCTELEWEDGFTVDSNRLRGTLNRLTGPSPWWSAAGVASDREYAAAEQSALLLSWLESLSRAPLLNRPDPTFLAGPHRHPLAWCALAARAGLPIRRQCLSTADVNRSSDAWGERPEEGCGVLAYVVGGEVVFTSEKSAIANGLVELTPGLLRLAADVGAGLLAVSLVRKHSGWCFAGVESLPPLQPGGEPLLDALARALTMGPETMVREEEEAR